MGHLRNIPVKLFQNLTIGSREEIFKELLKKFQFIAKASRVFDGIKFCEKVLKGTSQETFLLSLVQFGLEVWEMRMFKEIVDGGHWTTLAKSSP